MKPAARDSQQKLISMIMSGDLKPGDRLPDEQNLMQMLSCDRKAIQKTLSDLAARGLIIRRQRAGSFVAMPDNHTIRLTTPDKLGSPDFSQVLCQPTSISPTGHDSLRSALGTAASDRNFTAYASVLHLDGTATSLEEVLISPDLNILISGNPHSETIGNRIHRLLPWAAIDYSIRAIAADADIAERLHIKQDASCLTVMRLIKTPDRTLAAIRQTFVPDSSECKATFDPLS
ncbi:GntR family transcriptional regulator [Coralliovum pocilloporae]|uniref:GntR family transcriptional regulator n=1 Tax=Coralliovum pocilloporae TaxID=3066369 RepID=UPI003306B1D6